MQEEPQKIREGERREREQDDFQGGPTAVDAGSNISEAGVESTHGCCDDCTAVIRVPVPDSRCVS